MNEDTTNFFSEAITFENHWKSVTRSQINEFTDDFPGKEDFVAFYLAHNGGAFVGCAYFYPNAVYEVPNDYRVIEVASFLHIPSLEEDDIVEPYTISIESEKDRRIDYSDAFEDFVSFHIPFAENDDDNSFWIDIQTGEVKYIDFESMDYNPANAIVVASSFSDFCKRIESNFRVVNNIS